MSHRRPGRACLLIVAITCAAFGLAGCTKSKKAPVPEPLTYLEEYTAGARAEETLPMIVMIHGFGGSPELFSGLLNDLGEKARVILPRARRRQGHGYAWFDLCKDGNWDGLKDGMSLAADQVAELITGLVKTRPTKGKPIVSGFSQGGVIAFAMAARHPEKIGLAVPISGLLAPSLWPAATASKVAYPRVHALHGAADLIVPVDIARQTVDHFQQAGGDAELSVYPGVQHYIHRDMLAKLNSILRDGINPEGSGSHPAAATGQPLGI
jgi:phospholipase/carboxylesterase